MRELIIDRSRWLRGDQDSYLRREDDGKQCCLGFYLRALGVSEKRITGQSMPDVIPRLPKEASWLIDAKCDFRRIHSDDAGELADINDKHGVKSAAREKKVAAVFAKHGVAVRFVDGAK